MVVGRKKDFGNRQPPFSIRIKESRDAYFSLHKSKAPNRRTLSSGTRKEKTKAVSSLFTIRLDQKPLFCLLSHQIGGFHKT